MLEVADDARRLIDPRSTERLMALEVADVEVPAPRGASGRPALYFRILAGSATSLRIELWQLGQAHGARSVSAAGNAQLKARRIALAAAELARQLKRRRAAELAAAPAQVSGDRVHSTREAGFPVHAHFTWATGGRALVIGPGDAWVAGPTLGTALRFSSGPRVGLGASFLPGSVSGPSGGAIRWLDADLTLAYGFSANEGLEIETGLVGALASVRRSAASPTSPPFDTWSARAGLTVRADLRLSRIFLLGAGPEVGVLLRPIPGGGAEREVSGLWLGGGVFLRVDPLPRRE